MVNINFEVADEELHREFRKICIDQGVTMQDKLNTLIKNEVSKEARRK